jgi:hypothetical protein
MTKKKAEVDASKEEKPKVLAGGVTQAQLDGWKNSLGADEVKEIEVDLDENRKVSGYFKKPGLEVLAASTQKPDPITSGTVLFDNCYLGGDPEIKENNEVKFAVLLQLHKIFKVKTARIKNV